MAKKKFLVFGSEEGPKYCVPATLIAENRAHYYAKGVPGETQAACFDDEYDYALHNDEELLDWAGNNMNFEDFDPNSVTKIQPRNPKSIASIWADAWGNDGVSIIEAD